MAIAIGNKSQINPNPAASSYTLTTHNQNTGSDGVLIAAVAMQNTVNFSNATWNGVTMTPVIQQLLSGFSKRIWIWVLDAPATGVNNFVVNFTGSQFNPISVYLCSFTGAQTGGNTVSVGGQTTPHDETLTVSTNSHIYCTAISNAVITDIEVPLTDSRPAEFTHNINSQIEGSLSAAPLTSGSKTLRTECTSGTITLHAIEIQEAGGGGGGRRRIFIV